jgi:dephospho-CoA kinase
MSSDAIVHRLYAEDDEVRAALSERWGERTVDDRAAIAEIVFSDPDELAWLEQLLHPRVLREVEAWLDELRAQDDPPAVAVVEIPLLYETGGERRFDKVAVLTAPEDVRAARGAVRSDDRWRRLIPEDEKVRRADFAYVNDGTIDRLDEFVSGVVAELRS